MGLTGRANNKRKLLKIYGPVCSYCQWTFKIKGLNLDHVKPKSKGGKTIITNLVLSCFECNNKKGNSELSREEYFKLIELFPHLSDEILFE